MKAAIAAGRPQFGVSVMFPSPQIVEMIGHAGFDWALLDLEHGSIGLADLEVMAMAADAVGITPIARPASNADADIQAVLDRGAKGVQIPHVRSKAEAERVVRAAKFGPIGGRSLAAGTRPDQWGLGRKMPDFVAAQNAATLVCVQLEDREAIENADEILTAEHVDVFFIGPSDLSQSLGHPGDAKAPAVAAAIEGTLQKIRRAGKAPGMPAAERAVADVVDAGCLYIYTHLPRLIGASADAYLKAAGRS